MVYLFFSSKVSKFLKLKYFKGSLINFEVLSFKLMHVGRVSGSYI
jgi:hypothetical protein